MPDYAKSKIYRIVCNITGENYIGATTESLSRRLTGHVASAKRDGSHCRSKQIIDRGNYQILLLEDYPCERKEQLSARERFFIESMDCINQNIPTRTVSQYYTANRDAILEQRKNYHITNRDRILAYKRDAYHRLKAQIERDFMYNLQNRAGREMIEEIEEYNAGF